MSVLNKIPATTAPLTKLIRTTEGILVVLFNLTMLVVPIVSTFPATQAVKWAGIVNASTVISRQGLKAIATLSKTTGLTPIEPTGVPTSLDGLPIDDADATASMLDAPQSGVTPDPGTPDNPTEPEPLTSPTTDVPQPVSTEPPPPPPPVPPGTSSRAQRRRS